MRRRQMSKAASERVHAKHRAYERHGVKFNRHDLRAIALDIRNGNARFLGRQSNRVSSFEVYYRGEKYNAVYDSVRHTIVTFLTDEMLRKKSWYVPPSLEEE